MHIEEAKSHRCDSSERQNAKPQDFPLWKKQELLTLRFLKDL